MGPLFSQMNPCRFSCPLQSSCDWLRQTRLPPLLPGGSRAVLCCLCPTRTPVVCSPSFFLSSFSWHFDLLQLPCFESRIRSTWARAEQDGEVPLVGSGWTSVPLVQTVDWNDFLQPPFMSEGRRFSTCHCRVCVCVFV